MMRNTGSFLLIWLTIIVALVLSLLKLPIIVNNFVPNYVPMIVLYWVIFAPEKVNVGVSWLVGLLLDLLLGSTLGIHAAAMGFMAWIVVSQFQNIGFYSLLQKTIVVGTVNFIGQFLLFWIEHVFGVVTVDYDMFWSCLTTLILWPVFCGILNMLYAIVGPIRVERND